MVGTLGAVEGSVNFDFSTSDELAGAFRAAANKIEGQEPTRASYVTTAEQDFSGYFAQLFATNAATAAGDERDIVAALRQTATYADELAEQARAENERRQDARDYLSRHDHWWVHGWEWLVGVEVPPVGPPDDPITKPVEAPRTRTRQPLVGSGASGGVSSARPENLTTFATGSAQLNNDLFGLVGSLRSHLSDFEARCTYGTLSADGVVDSLNSWMEANDNDVKWATDVAGAFAAAGGTGGVDTLSNAALEAVLSAAGVTAVRADLDIAMPSAMGGPTTTGFTLDPVNTATGNFVEPEVDLAFAGGAASLALSRMYNSVDSRTGVFGPGWSSILEVGLELDDEGARWRLADGREVFFPRADSGWARGVGENYWLTRERATEVSARADVGPLAGEVLMVRDNAGAWWAFSPSGCWLASGCGPDNTITAHRDPEGRIVGLSHQRGRSLRVTYAGGRVAAATTSDGRHVSYAYDDAGYLIEVATAAGVRSYRWNDAGRIEAVISPAGVVEASNTYDARGRVLVQRSPFGREVHFSYLPGQITQVSDADGTRPNTWLADAKGRVIGVIDSAGNRQSMGWDEWGNLVSVIERDRASTLHTYDERGRRTRTIAPAGARTTYTYDHLDRITTETTTVVAADDAQAPSETGRTESTIRYEYATDADRDPYLIVDPAGGRTALTWCDGLLTRVVDPAGVTLDLDYDAHGDLIATTNQAGDCARIVRDDAGRPIRVITPAGHATGYAYETCGNLASRSDPDGAIWRFEHTPGGQLSAIIDPLGARTEFHYGPHGQLVRTIDPLGRSIERDFDDLGNLAAVHLPGGDDWQFTHDPLSRLIAVTDPAGGTWSRLYGPDGQLLVSTDPTGVRQSQSLERRDGYARVTRALAATTIQLDTLGRPICAKGPDGSIEQITYDPCGNPSELVDPDGGRTIIGRDAAGRITGLTTPAGAVTTYAYDTCGRLSTITDPLGAVTTLAYDADSHLTSRTDPTGQVEAFSYDPCGRLISHTAPGRGVARYCYDKAGHLTAVRDTWNGTRHFTYDAAGQLTTAVNGLGGRTCYGYDVRGRLVQVTDPAGAITTYTYDPCDHPTSITGPLGRTTTATYDGAGRLTSRTDPDGHTTSWAYDRAGLVQSISADGDVLSSITRDPKTRQTRITDHTRPDHPTEHLLEFNWRGQLTRHARDDRCMVWAYDADGARTGFTGPDGIETTYTHDVAGRVTAVDSPVLGRAAFDYDPAGRITAAKAGHLTQAWGYTGGFLTTHTRTTPDGIEKTQIQRDDEGQITALTEGETRTTFDYDAAAELIAATTTDVDGSRCVRRWTYDQAGHLTEEQTSAGTIGYRYDLASQLQTIEGPKDRTQFSYDGLGRRTHATTGAGNRTDYAWDRLGNLAHISTTTPDGASSSHELHVDAMGELAAVDDTDLWWDTAAPLPALSTIGNIGILPLATGLTGIGDTWTASGWRTHQTTTTNNPWDHNSVTPAPAGIGLTSVGGLTIDGLEWLGARVYDPACRGFLSTDPLSAVPGTTWAANPYAYAGNNPLALADPTGLRPATDQDLQNWAHGHQSHWKEALSDALSVLAVASAFIPVVDFVAPETLELGAAALDATTLSTDVLEATEAATGAFTSAVKTAAGALTSAAKAAAGALTSAAKTIASTAATIGRAADKTAATAAHALKPIAKAAAPTATRMGIRAAVGGTVSAGNYALTHIGEENGRELMSTTVTGATIGAATSFIDPAAGTISGKLAKSKNDWVTNHSRALVRASKVAMGFSVSGAGSVMQSNLAGADTDPVNVLATAASGAGSTYIPIERIQRAANFPTDGSSAQWTGAIIDSATDAASEILRKLLGLG